MKGGAFLKGKEGRVGFRTPSFKIDEYISKIHLTQKVINEAITQSPL